VDLASIRQPSMASRMPNHPKIPQPLAITTCVQHCPPKFVECFHASKLPHHGTQRHPLPMPPSETMLARDRCTKDLTERVMARIINSRSICKSNLQEDSDINNVATVDLAPKARSRFSPGGLEHKRCSVPCSSTTPPRRKNDARERRHRRFRQGQARS
jgi:hypothetical protein